jgi:hypothetical protein
MNLSSFLAFSIYFGKFRSAGLPTTASCVIAVLKLFYAMFLQHDLDSLARNRVFVIDLHTLSTPALPI